jgi:hypothetical protein
MAKAPDNNAAAAGFAALSICESLLLALTELRVLKLKDTNGVLEDAAAAHREMPASNADAAVHNAAAALIEQIILDRNVIPPT